MEKLSSWLPIFLILLLNGLVAYIAFQKFMSNDHRMLIKGLEEQVGEGILKNIETYKGYKTMKYRMRLEGQSNAPSIVHQGGLTGEHNGAESEQVWGILNDLELESLVALKWVILEDGSVLFTEINGEKVRGNREGAMIFTCIMGSLVVLIILLVWVNNIVNWLKKQWR
ncbi:MAG: hypothetical protein ACPG49_04905 [Chitinophagales bacterium]